MNEYALCVALCEALALREVGREWRGRDPFWARVAYRNARNRLAAIRRCEFVPSKWYVPSPVTNERDP